jgi:LCP family protein required for cell wall assembly
MAQKPTRSKQHKGYNSPPGVDSVAAQQSGNFPSIGMTLHSYQYDPRDKRRRNTQNPVVKQGRWQSFKSKITLKRAVITLVLLVVLIGGWVGGKFLYNAHKVFGGSIFNVFTTAKLKGEDEGRVNILLAGNSADDAGHDGGKLTDSIMLISIDTKNNKAFMLSIPRDLWVNVPGEGHQKINSAYVYGEENDFSANGYADGGMGQLEQVVSRNFGIPIHYYALVNYTALKQSVDAVGGIDITVNSKDPRGLYDPNIDWTTRGPLVKLSNGQHHLNGQQALNLARARGDAYNSYGFMGSDFDRTENQRKMLVALKQKAVSAGVITNPAKVSSLFDAIGNNVHTDLKLPEVRRLNDLTKNIGGSNLQSLSLNNDKGKNLLMSYTSPNGQSALIPAAGIDDFSDIKAFIRAHMKSDAVSQESATIVVLNGTLIDGLATDVKTQLTGKNLYVEKVGDAGSTAQQKTAVIDLTNGGKPNTKTMLVKTFNSSYTTQNPYGNLYDADFIIVLGNDQAKAGSTANQSLQ